MRLARPVSIRVLFGALMAVVMVLAAALFSVTVLQSRTATQRTAAEHQLVTGFLLSDQMRQSSNDLTEMVRLYVTTGDTRYRRYYNDILAIRAGTAPRPVNYDSSFWDRRLAAPSAKVRYEKPSSLPDQVRQAGFTGREFRALDASLNASNSLAQLEKRVIDAVAPIVARGVGRDYPVEVESEYRQLVDANYYHQKGIIMAAIGRFTSLIDAQTAARETSLQHRTTTLLVLQTGMLVLLALVLLVTLGLASRMITRPLARLTSVTRRIAGGDWSQRAPLGGVSELRDLAQNFDEMSDAVQSDLEARRRAEEAAASADRAKSAFLAMTSHELRTPLVAVTGTLELLEHGQLRAEERRLVAVASRSAQTLLTVIGDVLDFSKIEAGHLDLAPVPTAIAKLAEDVVAQHRLAASGSEVEVRLWLDPRLAAEHLVDPGRLRQVLGNLLNNALKFTSAGWVELRVEVRAQDGGAQRLALIVADTGVGISEADQARLFQPFEQARGDVVAQRAGTGLGLVICRQLVEAMGGTVGLQSELGVGTVLCVELTLMAVGVRGAGGAEAGGGAGAGSAGIGNGGGLLRRALPSREEAIAEGSLLLLVEDHPVNREVLVQGLAMIGFVTDSAADAEEALARFSETRYGLVFTDIQLPGDDGRALSRRLRELERQTGRPRTPVIALTAHALAGERERCVEAGMDDLVVKPATLATLSATLRRWLAECEWPSGSDGFDAEFLDELTAGDAELRVSILHRYRHSMDEELADLQAARDDGDFERVRFHAHRMAGASATVGAQGVRAAATAVEQAVIASESEEAVGRLCVRLSESVQSSAIAGPA